LTSLEESLRLAHGGLDVQGLDVLPLLLAVNRKISQSAYLSRQKQSKDLQQRDQEVDGQHDVLHDFVLGHGNVTDGNSQTQDLLQLELDGGSDFVGLLGEVVGVRNGGREFTSCQRLVVRYMGYATVTNTHPWKDRDPTDEESA
jgi:hypothetical protein